MKTVTVQEIRKAHELLKTILTPTPLIKNQWLSNQYGCEVYLKLENMQPIGSFKIRGGINKISRLSDDERKKGVIAASAGNHAQGVAWAAKHFKTDALIVMPETAPLMKVHNTQALGATVQQVGENYDQAFAAAQSIMAQTGRTYIHAFHDADVIAGQGTAAIEILDQLPDVDFIVSSIGGGGLTAGMGIYLKEHSRKVHLIGCQAMNSPAMVQSIREGKVTEVESRGTFADGIAVQKANPDLFKILNEVVDDTFESDDEEIAMNVLQLMEKAKIVVEGSGAIVLGALERFKAKMKGKKVVLVISGGNIDVNLVSRIIDRGLIRSGRRIHLRVQISDRPGSLSKLTALIASLKCNVLQAVHDRSEMRLKLDETEVELLLETKGEEHSQEVIAKLKDHCKRVEVIF